MAEAARRIGITEKAVRERIKHGSIDWRPKGNSGREVLVTPEMEHDESSRESPGIGREVAELRIEIARLEERLAAAGNVRAAIEAKAQAAVDAATLAAKAEVESMRVQVATQLAARNAVIEELKAGLEHSRAERDRLSAELAEARKGWLERLLEAVRRR